MRYECVTLALGLVALPAVASAQVRDTAWTPSVPSAADEMVVQHDLSGPRLGGTFTKDGEARSQFGWHFEHQAAPGSGGPWFVVETVLLAAGMERSEFIPSGTVVFGLRLPNGFEFGLGPSVTVGGASILNSGVVFAAGHSFRVGGIRVPLNLAFVAGEKGDHRVTLVTGWAIRDRATP